MKEHPDLTITAKNATNQTIPLVLFSGGLDSTYLLFNLLKETDVYTLYSSSVQGPYKIACEESARKEILLHLSKDNKHCNVIEDYRVDENYPVFFAPYGAQKFTQILPWLYAALGKADPAIHSCVMMSYVLGDDAVVAKNDIVALWENLWKVCRIDMLVPLRFPLLDHGIRKQIIYGELPKELLKLTWVCELPVMKSRNYAPCGKCGGCLRQAAEYTIYKKRTNTTLPAHRTIPYSKRTSPVPEIIPID